MICLHTGVGRKITLPLSHFTFDFVSETLSNYNQPRVPSLPLSAKASNLLRSYRDPSRKEVAIVINWQLYEEYGRKRYAAPIINNLE